MQQCRIFDGNRLRATLFNPGQPRLYVTFRHRVSEPGQSSEPRSAATFIQAGYAHLHRAARLKSPRCWARLAAAAAKSGRPELENHALKRLGELNENLVL